jgi:4-hydroxy-tetrahydrodipicolinate reductase
MGVNIVRYAIEKGAEIVAAFDNNPDLVGTDIGTHVGLTPQGVAISDAKSAEGVLAETEPDICLIATQSLIKDVKDIMAACARNGVNAISTCEEAIFAWNSSPAIALELNALAKAGGCTLTGTGANESQYGGMFGLFGGNAHSVTKIVAKAQYNVDDYGIALARGHGVGLTSGEFQQQIASIDDISDAERQALIEKGEFLPSYVWNTNGWICDYLGLTVTGQSQRCTPKYADIDIESNTLGTVIPAGNVIGMGAVATTETKEGVTIETECIGIVYGQGEEDYNESVSIGVPDMEILIKNPATVEMTCATIVNRIPDVINAQPGYVPTSRMPVLKYRAHDLHHYVVSR